MDVFSLSEGASPLFSLASFITLSVRIFQFNHFQITIAELLLIPHSPESWEHLIIHA